jgi:hypothetical protein
MTMKEFPVPRRPEGIDAFPEAAEYWDGQGASQVFRDLRIPTERKGQLLERAARLHCLLVRHQSDEAPLAERRKWAAVRLYFRTSNRLGFTPRGRAMLRVEGLLPPDPSEPPFVHEVASDEEWAAWFREFGLAAGPVDDDEDPET